MPGSGQPPGCNSTGSESRSRSPTDLCPSSAGCAAGVVGTWSRVMKHYSANQTEIVGTARKAKLTGAGVLATALVAIALTGCNDHAAAPNTRAAIVRTEIVQSRDRQASVTLTGEVQAHFRAELSFRVSGRVLARYVDVGTRVQAGEVLALLDPAEQQADVDAATAAVLAGESQLRVARATFERQKALIASSFTTRTVYDQAQEGLRTA